MLLSLLVLTTISRTSASICSGKPASPNWYGTAGYPPYLSKNSPEKCPQKYELSRCEQSAVMMDPNSGFPTENDVEVCTSNIDCFPTKVNCNDTPVCSALLKLKDELMDGGHNIVCRHEKTQWQMHPGEMKGCHLDGDCLSSEEKKSTQRQLHPHGYEGAKAFTDAFRGMNIPVGREFSSPFSRCVRHAELFADSPTEERDELVYAGDWREVLSLYGVTEKKRSNALKLQSHNLRNFAGKKPAPGTNDIFVTHGINIKNGFGLTVDEGYCLVLKPDDREESLALSIGPVTIGNLEFEYDVDAFPVEVVARTSPESANHMQTCDDVRNDDVESAGSPGRNIRSYDADHDMDVSEREFIEGHGADEPNSADAFEFVRSVRPTVLGKPPSSSIELGQFFHMNWGWREIALSSGGIAFPWRTIVENTVGRGGATRDARVLAFDRANAILSALAFALSSSSETYPTRNDMEDKLLHCEDDALPEAQILALAACGAGTYLAESGGDDYYPMGPGDGGLSGEYQTLFGSPLAYPSVWEPDLSDDKYSKVGRCLVVMGEVTFEELMESMGCAVSPGVGGGSVVVTGDGGDGGGGGDDLEGATSTTNLSSVRCSSEWEPVAYVFAALFGVTLAALLCIAYRKRKGVRKIKMEKVSTVEEA